MPLSRRRANSDNLSSRDIDPSSALPISSSILAAMLICSALCRVTGLLLQNIESSGLCNSFAVAKHTERQISEGRIVGDNGDAVSARKSSAHDGFVVGGKKVLAKATRLLLLDRALLVLAPFANRMGVPI